MDSLKTQTVVVSNTNKVNFEPESRTGSLTSRQIHSYEQDPTAQEHKTVKQQIQEVRNEVHDTRKIQSINPFFSYFPNFYRKEIKNAFRIMIAWITIGVVTFALTAFAVTEICLHANEVSPGVSLLFIPILVIVTALTIVYVNKYYCFRTEAKSINFKDEKTLSINAVKLYKRLKTGHINVNWMCLLTYVAGGLIILINFIVAYATTHIKFGTGDASSVDEQYRGEYVAFEITFWSAVVGILLAVVLHVVLLTTNYIRAARIENFYNFMIVPQEELNLIKKQKSRRDLIIFLSVVAGIGLVGGLIYKLVRRNRATKVVVS